MTTQKTNKYEVVMNGNTTQLACKQLQVNVNSMIKALNTIDKSTWQYAISLHRIIKEELYKDDFKNIKEFSQFIDFSQSNITKYVQAVDFSINVLSKDYTIGSISLSKCYILSCLNDNYNDFITFYKENTKEELTNISKNKLEDLIKLYKKSLDNVVDNENENGENENQKELSDDDIIEFTIDKVNYQMPYKVLKKYQVKEDKESK